MMRSLFGDESPTSAELAELNLSLLDELEHIRQLEQERPDMQATWDARKASVYDDMDTIKELQRE